MALSLFLFKVSVLDSRSIIGQWDQLIFTILWQNMKLQRLTAFIIHAWTFGGWGSPSFNRIGYCLDMILCRFATGYNPGMHNKLYHIHLVGLHALMPCAYILVIFLMGIWCMVYFYSPKTSENMSAGILVQIHYRYSFSCMWPGIVLLHVYCVPDKM